jgi:hypothetical protein
MSGHVSGKGGMARGWGAEEKHCGEEGVVTERGVPPLKTYLVISHLNDVQIE